MAERTWQVDGRNGLHIVGLQHEYVSGKATITVDGEVVFHRHRQIVDFGLKQHFTVDGVECVVRVTPLPWLMFWYRFSVVGSRRRANRLSPDRRVPWPAPGDDPYKPPENELLDPPKPEEPPKRDNTWVAFAIIMVILIAIVAAMLIALWPRLTRP